MVAATAMMTNVGSLVSGLNATSANGMAVRINASTKPVR